jgi:hypothetical protein
MTGLMLGPEPEMLPLPAWIGQWWINAWPVMPTLAALLVLDRGGSLRLVAQYVAAGSVVLVVSTLGVQLARGSLNSAVVTNVFWMLAGVLLIAWLPLVLLLVTGWRRVRAVMPLALATTLLFGFALMASTEAFIRALDVAAFRDALLQLAVVTSAESARYAPFMLMSLPIGWLAWIVLRRLARGFERKRFSDVQLIVDCWWIVVTAEQTATSLATTYGGGGVLGGAAAFAAYRIAVALALCGARVETDRSRRLLLLRVFGYEARTESLFDRIAQRWRFHGPVQLIAGADLAMRTADPGDILAFVNGRLAEHYVRSPDDIARRIGSLDLGRDPDMRYRVNEVYCRDDTWRPTLEALLDASDIVLMDLRSFRHQNAGCIFELEQLVRRVATDDIVLVCDKTTDLPLLGRVLGSAWQEAHRQGVARGSGVIALVRMEGHSRRELGLLMARLLGGGESRRRLAVSDLPGAFT